jgi:hypothetical protein
MVEKGNMVIATSETISHKLLSMNAHDVNNAGDSESVLSEKPIQDAPEDQYPTGLKLVVLAGASMVSVFMIALDQVSTPSP